VTTNFLHFQRQITHPLKFRLFMLKSLPSAWFAGLKVVALEEAHAVISVRYGWFNKNPFRSIYFAVLSMAAEVSTGIVCMGHSYRQSPSVSMLLVASSAVFHKKAIGKILFTCNDGDAVKAAVLQAIATQQPVTVACTSAGKNEQGEVVAEFIYTWSFKTRGRK